MTLTIQVSKIWPSLLLFCILLVPGSTHDRNKSLEPEFDVKLPNLTVKQGSDASFTCVVKHLGEYKVAWIRSEDKAIIAYGNHMVTHNHRFVVTHNGHNTWTLHIKSVQKNDTGTYMCQVNTDPMRSQLGSLDVVVPADIIDAETSGDVAVSEGQPAVLKCKATGYPPPKVMWQREGKQPLPITRELLSSPKEEIEIWEGERLPLRPLQRADTGPYFCVANNSVPPKVSKRVMVYVHFQPSIKVLNQLVAAPLGMNATLECIVEAVPKPQMHWFNKEGQLILSSPGRIWQETEVDKNNYYQLTMKLHFTYLQKEDFTEYNCTAGNALGADYAIIKLQLLPTPITQRPTTTTTHYYRPKHPNQNGRYTDESPMGPGQGNIKVKHQNHRRKFQRKGHRNEGGAEFSEVYGEDVSLDPDMLTTAPSSGGGPWGLDGRSNSRNSQRSSKDGVNSINSFNNNNRNSNSNNNNGRYGGGAMDHPNLEATSRSSRLIMNRFTSTARCSSLLRSLMPHLYSHIYLIFLTITIMLIPVSALQIMFLE